MVTEIIIKQLLVFGILIAIGSLAFWRKVITEEIKNNLARIIIDVTLPFLIFSTLANMNADATLLRNGLFVFLLAYVNLLVFWLIGKFSSKILKLDNAQETVHTLHTMLGNTVFLGFPLLDAIFPNGLGIFYGAVYQLASNSITFTYGVSRLSAGIHKSGWRSLINFNTIALGLGGFFLALGIKLPSLVMTSFGFLGNCTSPLSMVYIGAMLASMNIKSSLFQRSVFVLSFNRLLLAPLLMALIFAVSMFVFGFKMSKEAYFVLILQAAMPCQTIVAVMVQRFNGDYRLAGANLFVSTLLSIATLPLVYFCLEWLWIKIG
jgi:malate permease and related proteins